MPRTYSEYLEAQEAKEDRKPCPFVPARPKRTDGRPIIVTDRTDEDVERIVAHMRKVCGAV